MGFKTNTKEYEFISLFDFLGKAAGPELGKEVNRVAKLSSQPIAIKQVSNPKYKGSILMYTNDFLVEYFKVNPKY